MPFDLLAIGLEIVKIFNLPKLTVDVVFPSTNFLKEAFKILECYDNQRPWAQILKGSKILETGMKVAGVVLSSL